VSTDDRPSVPNPASRSRRWWFLLLGLVILGAGALWWSKRLTPEERLLVGHWTVTARLPDGSQALHDWEFLSNRQIRSNGAWWNWTATGDRFTVQQHDPALAVIWTWVTSGFKTRLYETPSNGRIEIISSQEARIVFGDSGQGAQFHLRRASED
jgi:hypothetical protein